VSSLVRFSLDTNLLVYATDGRDPLRQSAAIEIFVRAARRDCVPTVQVLSEFFHAVSRKGIIPRSEAAPQVRRWMDVFALAPAASASALALALEAATAGRFQFYDALLLATAREAGCTAVVSADMADGAELDG
jgi:predicted nucleic acid-binding protein